MGGQVAFCWFSSLEEKKLKGHHGLPCGRGVLSWPPLPLLLSSPTLGCLRSGSGDTEASSPRPTVLTEFVVLQNPQGNADFPGGGRLLHSHLLFLPTEFIYPGVYTRWVGSTPPADRPGSVVGSGEVCSEEVLTAGPLQQGCSALGQQ